MTISRPSPSEGSARALDLLGEPVARWVRAQGWPGLRDIQIRAVEPVLGGHDVLIAAPTAAGKTEAALLPMCSMLAFDPGGHGFGVLYVAPLKALIDDVAERMEGLCGALEIPLHAWHGDVSSSRKGAARRDPGGVLLITPESLEALFVRRGEEIPGLFGGLTGVVVDEVHAFVGTERGAQVRSLLHRVDLRAGRAVPRVGLSATVADVAMAAEFLRPGGGAEVAVIVAPSGGQEVRVRVHGYRDPGPAPTPPRSGGGPVVLRSSAAEAIARDLFRHLRGSDNLAFCNTRASVERYADLLAELSDRAGVRGEFHPHHGSLSRGLRSEAEAELRGHLPATAVCTTTLELGIDIGSVRTIAQIGPPFSVAGLRQRLGRSGRRGEPARLRIYVAESSEAPRSPVSALRTDLVQSIAVVNLLLDGWLEAPVPGVRHLSTLVQQILSVVCERGGATPLAIGETLGGDGAAFEAVTAAELGQILRSIGRAGLLQQLADGTLVLGPKGERLVAHHSFYAAFATPEEWRVVGEGRALGTLPVLRPLERGQPLLFGGRRWRVTGISERRRLLELVPAGEGFVPEFGGLGPAVPARVRREMLQVYRGADAPAFLDPVASELLAEGREAFGRLGLRQDPIVSSSGNAYAFCWAGDRGMDALCLALRARALDAGAEGVAIRVAGIPPGELRGHLRALAATEPPDGAGLAARSGNPLREKHDQYLPRDMLLAEHAARSLDVAGAWEAARRLAQGDPGAGPSCADPLAISSVGGRTALGQCASALARADLR